MKIWHLALIFPAAVMSGWLLHLRQLRGDSAPVAARAEPRQVTEILPAPRGVSDFMTEAARLKTCSGNDCKELSRLLFAMAEWGRIENGGPEEFSTFARDFLASNDSSVREAALDLLSTLPKSSENLESILHNIVGGTDSELVASAMLELERYQASEELDKIERAFAAALTSGTPVIAREISENLAPFLNAHSVRFFQEVAERLPAQSAYRTNLEVMLTESGATH